jgi:MoxR-like ATPase
MTSAQKTSDFYFIGKGDSRELASRLDRIRPWNGEIGPWKPRRGEQAIPDDAPHRPADHPANYAASPDLAHAVNTAIALERPLLVTGNPGTGKSQLAERIAWELNLSPVLRFEAQSLSEANDLFYRFDLIGYLSQLELDKARNREQPLQDSAREPSPSSSSDPSKPTPSDSFLTLGPLGEAIVRSDPEKHARLLIGELALAPETAAAMMPRPSVVLIDEIDKASRDFPNDLLNGIERREFGVRELRIPSVAAHKDYPPIVIITSNSERELPAPFLRRCVFFHISDPGPDVLADILIRKFFSPSGRKPDGTRETLPKFYQQLLEQFVLFRERPEGLQYPPGTSELIDWTQALRLHNVDPGADLQSQLSHVRETASAVAKHRDDLSALGEFLQSFSPRQA